LRTSSELPISLARLEEYLSATRILRPALETLGGELEVLRY